MKKLLFILALFLSIKTQAQTNSNCNCMAFSEGCWTLIGASNGVELYVTHKKVARPNMADKGFNIVVYSKIVNLNNVAMESGLGVSSTFYYYDIDRKVMAPKEIVMDKSLDPRQVIVKYQEVFTNSADISYSQIRSFIYTNKR